MSFPFSIPLRSAIITGAVLSAILATVSESSPSSPFDEGSLVITVRTKSEAGDAIPSIHVRIFETNSKRAICMGETDDEGRFESPPLKEGQSYYIVAPLSLKWEAERVLLDPLTEDHTDVVFTLAARDRTIRGRVLVYGTDEPLSGVRVQIDDQVNARVVKKSGKDGRFSVRDVAAKDYKLRLTHPSIPAGYTVYPIRGGNEDEAVIYLPDPRSEPDTYASESLIEKSIGKIAPPGAPAKWIVPEGESPPKLEGRAVWIRFLASYARYSWKDLEQLYELADDEGAGVVVLVHTASACHSTLERWYREREIELPLMIDQPNRHASLGSTTLGRYGIDSLAIDVLIDREGVIRHVDRLPKDLERSIERWLELTE